jgi:ferredoxin
MFKSKLIRSSNLSGRNSGRAINSKKNDGKIIIDRYKCAYCGACIAVCKYDANELVETFVQIDDEKCTLCKACVRTCPMRAIEVIEIETATGVKS